MKKKETCMLVGVILIAFGVFVFFRNTQVYSWGFYQFNNGISTGGILIALTLLDVVLFVATRSKITKIMIPILIAMMILSVILGTHLHYYGSLLDLFLILAPAAVGVGLVLRSMLSKEA